MSTILITGFPGFLGSALLPRILEPANGSDAVCLVQSRFADLARERVAKLEAMHPALRGRIEIVEGDITQPGLGVAGAAELQRRVREVFHLAAVYDLAVKRRVGMRINVDGTRHVLDFCEDCADFERLHYVSTCYVSGRYAGIFSEDDLDKGQEFNNYYEETKFLAEIEVRQRMRAGLPATVYRPSIVVGDSRTGATQKFDGPYYVIGWILRQPRVAVVPVVGSPKTVRVNLVPSDFVVEAFARISRSDSSRGLVYHLADPDPLTVDELLKAVARATGRWLVRVPLLKGAAKAAINWVPGVYRLMRIPSPAIDYFVHPTHYTTCNTTEALAGTGIRVPPFTSYVDTLVRYMRQHPEIGSGAMV